MSSMYGAGFYRGVQRRLLRKSLRSSAVARTDAQDVLASFGLCSLPQLAWKDLVFSLSGRSRPRSSPTGSQDSRLAISRSWWSSGGPYRVLCCCQAEQVRLGARKRRARVVFFLSPALLLLGIPNSLRVSLLSPLYCSRGGEKGGDRVFLVLRRRGLGFPSPSLVARAAGGWGNPGSTGLACE